MSKKEKESSVEKRHKIKPIEVVKRLKVKVENL